MCKWFNLGAGCGSGKMAWWVMTAVARFGFDWTQPAVMVTLSLIPSDGPYAKNCLKTQILANLRSMRRPIAA